MEKIKIALCVLLFVCLFSYFIGATGYAVYLFKKEHDDILACKGKTILINDVKYVCIDINAKPGILFLSADGKSLHLSKDAAIEHVASYKKLFPEAPSPDDR